MNNMSCDNCFGDHPLDFCPIIWRSGKLVGITGNSNARRLANEIRKFGVEIVDLGIPSARWRKKHGNKASIFESTKLAIESGRFGTIILAAPLLLSALEDRSDIQQKNYVLSMARLAKLARENGTLILLQEQTVPKVAMPRVRSPELRRKLLHTYDNALQASEFIKASYAAIPKYWSTSPGLAKVDRRNRIRYGKMFRVQNSIIRLPLTQNPSCFDENPVHLTANAYAEIAEYIFNAFLKDLSE